MPEQKSNPARFGRVRETRQEKAAPPLSTHSLRVKGVCFGDSQLGFEPQVCCHCINCKLLSLSRLQFPSDMVSIALIHSTHAYEHLVSARPSSRYWGRAEVSKTDEVPAFQKFTL